MKKVFDQTVRDLKREVNKKVLKVPGIEQKVLDATSNEPWGPHGSLLADIAHATRNYHEYQIIMHVIWKRLNDTGKNWRHVYKALTVLEYLVGHGSERVIDDIREHAYQISTLSDFQYIDSSGKDQGSNVRRKSQSLVTLVNDKEKIQEVRQKALINKDKYRSTFATGGRSPYSGSGSNGDRCDEDRYEGRYRDSYEGRYRDDDRNGYGRDRDWGSKDDEIYGRGSDPYNRDGDRYGRDSDDRYGRDSYRDDENKGGRGNGYSQFGPRNRSFDRDRDQFFEEDDRYSSRGGRVEEQSQDGRRLERKLSEQSPPPSYEETVKAAHGQVQDRRSVESAVPSGTEVYSPPKAKEIFPMSTNQHPDQSAAGVSASASNKEADGFDEFDPRGSIPAVSASASGSGVDLFGDQSASVPVHSMALVPVDFAPTLEAEAPVYSGVGTNFVPLSSASTALSQPGEDPFGDGPFRATAQGDFQAQQHGFAPATSFQPSSNIMVHGAAVEPPAPGAPKVENALSFDFGDALGGLTYTPNTVNGHHHFASNPPSVGNEFLAGQVNDGTFDGIQTSGPSSFVPPHAFQQPVYPTNMHPANMNYLPQPGLLGTSAPRPAAQSVHAPYMQPTPMSLHAQPGLSLQPTPMSLHTQPGLSLQPTPMSLHTQPGLSLQPTTQTVHTAQGAQPPKDKFETKSTVWSDTLNRGLVNLNISGAKVNPLADIGVDFDAINRMDKRKERSSAAPVTSTITMGKAMGSGSGIGRATAGGIVPPPNPMMGSNTGMGMGRGMGMGGYGMGMNPPMGMGMGMNMNMNMGMNQEAPMRPPAQVPGMGMGGYGTQPPYGGGYR